MAKKLLVSAPKPIITERGISPSARRTVGLRIVTVISPALKDIVDNCIVPALVKIYLQQQFEKAS